MIRELSKAIVKLFILKLFCQLMFWFTFVPPLGWPRFQSTGLFPNSAAKYALFLFSVWAYYDIRFRLCLIKRKKSCTYQKLENTGGKFCGECGIGCMDDNKGELGEWIDANYRLLSLIHLIAVLGILQFFTVRKYL